MLAGVILVGAAAEFVRVYRARQTRRRLAARYPIANRYRRPGWAERV